ncbi:MAG TPA: SCO family protein [Bacteroidetes bacterium]|nr:SCO family protein [Bacteroidota bacterium]
MKKMRPAITLFAVLVLPVLIFLFLQTGTHVVKPLKIISPIITNPNNSSDSVYKVVQDFAFPSQNGDTITLDSFSGAIWVADVFFTRCEGVCPKLTSALMKVQRYYRSDPEVKFLSISVDPKNDSIPVLRDYADMHEAIDHKWYMITGEKERLYNFAHKEFFFSATADADSTIRFVHDKTLRLVDKEGRFRGKFYDATNPTEVDSLISHIQLLKREYAQEKR